MNGYVYLAGAITGQSGEEAHGWRDAASIALRSHGYRPLDPLRGHQVRDLDSIPADFDDGPASVQRDLDDIDRAKFVIVNLCGILTSVGTNAELGYAYSRGKVAYGFGTLEEIDAVKDHPFYELMLYPTKWTGVLSAVQDTAHWHRNLDFDRSCA